MQNKTPFELIAEHDAAKRRYTKDAEGHEHSAENGQFVSGGSESAAEKPKTEETKQKKPKTPKINLPKKSPSSIRVVDYEKAKANYKAKFVPRAPKDGESCLLLGCPQAGAYEFLEYTVGDLLKGYDGNKYVVTAAKPMFTRSGEGGGWKTWEQRVIARPATDMDLAAVGEQQNAQDAETKRVLSQMMDR
jgi:hypothetical protein